ncbi:MAG: ABC transporter permease [Candidatus Acidiferrum sp.]
MNWLKQLFSRRHIYGDLSEEIREHLEEKTEELVATGMSKKEASAAARRQFGNVTLVEQDSREVWQWLSIESFFADLRFAARMLRKNPGFTAIAVLTLALGIGANSAIFSLVNSVLLRPLSYKDPQQLYVIREIVPQWTKFSPLLAANLPDFQLWQKECRSFEQIAVAEALDVDLSGAGDAEEIHGIRASANLLEVLGEHPALGRSFLPEEDQAGHDRVVILTDRFWRGRFHGDLSVVGQTITLDGESHVVIGILPPSFHFPKEIGSSADFGSRIDFFKPLGGPRFYEQDLIGEFDFAAIARLKPGVTPAQALAELNVVQAGIAKQANENLDLAAALFPLELEIVGPARKGLILLLAAVGAVLLIVCVNLANLLLARIPGRMREAAIRTALGAARSRLLRQLLTESLLLSFIGGTLGIALAHFGVFWLVSLAPVSLPRLDEVVVDGRVLSFAFLLSAVVGGLFGILPAWRISRADPQAALKSGSATTSEGRRPRQFRESLIGLEVGLCTALLILAGLLTSSLLHVIRINPGFSVERVLAADVSLPPQSYAEVPARTHFYEQVLAGVRSLPGVESAGWVTILPLEGQGSVTGIALPGEQSSSGERLHANYRAISPDYFRTMAIPLIEGRYFTENDRGKKLVIISKSVADRLWPGQNPLGRECIAEWGELQRSQVIGVVGDIRTVTLEAPPLLMVYTADSFGQQTPGAPQSASIVVRTAADPDTLAGTFRSVIRNVDPNVPILALRPMSQVVSETVDARRFQMLLAALFAVCALLLASLGIFGVVSYSVEQRRHELGIRLAMGAQGDSLLRLILRQGMTPVVLGLLSGIAVAGAGGRLIQNLLFGVTAFDPLTVACVTLLVVLVAMLACYIPARRAMRIDPIVALRYE